MAKQEELGIRLRIQGLEETRRALQGVNSQLGQTEQAGRKAARTMPGGGGGRMEGGAPPPAAGGPSAGKMAAGVAGGMMIASAFQQMNQAFQQTARVALDPSLTRTERDLRMGQAALSTIPGVGGALSAAAGIVGQSQVNVAQGTQQRLDQIFGPAFEAFGAMNPGLDANELRSKMEDRFGPMIGRAKGHAAASARGREAGSQILADLSGDSLSVKQMYEDAKAQLSKVAGDMGISDPVAAVEKYLQGFSDALDNLQDNTSSMARALDQIADYWRGVMRGGSTQ